MANKVFPTSQIPIRKTSELLPAVFQTPNNDKFLSSTLDPLTQPGVLDKISGYAGRRYGKTFKGTDIYLDTDNTLRSRYQLEVGVTVKQDDQITNFYDYLDLKNQLKFFGNNEEQDNKLTEEPHYTWDPPIDWDKFVNYREYYWETLAPPPVAVLGQASDIISTYTVKLGTGSTYVFTPDAFTSNPTITLYRGQTYKFKINAPYEGLMIKTNYDTGSLLFNPNIPYTQGSLVVFDNKLWKAKVAIRPDGSTISLETEDWEFVDNVAGTSALDYNEGVTNNGVENGTLTFKVPVNAPDILFYQSKVDPNRFGKFVIADIEENTKINIELDILGKADYISSNGIIFTNGLVVDFRGQVTPAYYARDSWVVEGVGKAITLTKVSDLIPTEIPGGSQEVLFDFKGFDTQPFDDASQVASLKDYIVIARDSIDQNPWSRYNRWFHRSVLEYAYKLRGQDFPATESQRASRPIIEFNKNIQLFSHGYKAKPAVDFIDKFTTDVFSTIEGSQGYTIESEPLFDGARILITADTDDLANNRIYTVKFIIHNNRRQITLIKTDDTDPNLGETVLIKRGNLPANGGNRGLMYHFDGSTWIQSQRKTQVNQAPLFDAFDAEGVSFSDQQKYPTSTFVGNKILSYTVGSGPKDKELGFPISYLNIDNVGDIQFDWNWEKDNFVYTIDRVDYTKEIKTGFYKILTDQTYANGWSTIAKEYLQPIIDSVVIESVTDTIRLSTVEWRFFKDETSTLNFYVNGYPYKVPYSRNLGIFTFEQSFQIGDVVSLKLITDIPPDQGYYEIPAGLEKNPLNSNLLNFTLGQAVDHLTSSLEFNNEFQGKLPGVGNLRDINGYQKYAKRFLKHFAPAPLAMMLLCDKSINIIKSLQYAKKSYSEFKNSFLTKAVELEYPGNPVDFVDNIIEELSRSKNTSSPFSNSDMIGNGAYTAINYVVEDTGITTFALSQNFNLQELSQRAVYVYINKQQLINETDYAFDSTFGFVRIRKSLNEGDEIEIREYISTAFNYIPPTPTSLGLYKKYLPYKFEDNTYVTPKEVIQGHDGSLVDAYGDYRDDVLLELELRIYNNIKKNYDSNLYNLDNIAGGYYGNSVYDKYQVDDIVTQEFLKWIQNTSINYIDNGFFDSQNEFTYTYSNMSDPTQTRRLPGYWRGVYKWFYDTDRPHERPWEMLGFTEKPTWWEDQYGPAPYTSENLLLWEDLKDGIIRQGSRAGTYDRYKRPSLLNHLPVNDKGDLLDPLSSNLAQDFSLINNTGPFSLGDIGPAEHAWRVTSEYPFAFTIAMCLLRPFEFIASNYDNSKVKFNIINQLVSAETDYFVTISDLVKEDNTELACGLVQYIKSYVKSRDIASTEIYKKLSKIDVNLSHRLSGFVDKEQQKYLLDSKSPKSQTSNIFIPLENYDVIFNVSSPITTITYSGVIVEKTDRGWILRGYDDLRPYFNYYEAIANQKDPLMQVGGVSENFKDWEPDVLYSNGQLIRYRVEYYRAIKTHKSSDSFEMNNWKRVPAVPLIGGVEAYKRRTFNKITTKKLYYGTVLQNIQQVVDFLFGYESWQKDQGIVFDGYNNQLASPYDWTTSVKEFMFWTRQSWANGSLIALSPISQEIKVNIPVGVADNLLDAFYDYRILRDDGKILRPEFINVLRDFQTITISTNDQTTDGIFFIRINYVLKEHVTVFDDRTVFNDIIYDKATGYRQERIKVKGYRTVDWDGDYTSPGFLFDNVNIQVWQPFIDYKLGDIVAYRSYYWTSLKNQLGSETFDINSWSRLDIVPQKSLIANFDYRINQIEDYYNVSSEGLGASQRMLARHALGYQTREYLQNLAEDEVTQFNLYQGFIREKGTNNAITKVFNKLSRSGTDSIELNEEWALRVGSFGGVDQYQEIELELLKDNFVINPQPIVVMNTIPDVVTDQNYNVTQSDFSLYSEKTFNVNINPTSYQSEPIKTAGYVKTDQVEHIIKSKDDLLNYNILDVKENDHLWIAFDKTSWTVLRFNESPLLSVENVSKAGTTVTISLNRRHNLQIGDIIGLKIQNLTGFYKVTNNEIGSSTNAFEILNEVDGPEPELGDNLNYLYLLTTVRFDSYADINEESAALLNDGSRLFVDNNGDNLWEVSKKKKQFSFKTVLDSGISSPSKLGQKVLYSESLKLSFVSDPDSGVVAVYSEAASNINIKQIITPPVGLENAVKGSFGEKMAISPDNKFLIVAAPFASGVPSTFRGDLDKFLYADNDDDYTNAPPTFVTKIINANDIFVYRGRLWRSKVYQTLLFDGSTKIDVYTEDWEPAESIPLNVAGVNPGYSNQGTICIYEYVNQQWELKDTLLSPRPADGELFGSDVTIGVNGSDYYLAVSAIGSQENTGRVYLYNYVKNESAVQSFFGSLCNYATNTIDFNDPHNYFTGQKVFYYNGTVDGVNTSTQDQPPPPENNTEFWVIAVDRFRIQLASTIQDARDNLPLSLLDIGIDDSSSHTLIREIRQSGWRHLENQNYRGIYGEIPRNPTYGSLSLQPAFYPAGSIVWSNGKLWEAQVDTVEDGSTLSTESNDWLEVASISTDNSLPFNLNLGDDHSTLDLGLLSDLQTKELVKEGDKFGMSLAMNRDASILAVGAPLSDGQFFTNFKGVWRPDIEYIEGDVVKYFDNIITNTWTYYKLVDNRTETTDSTVRSFNEMPGENTLDDGGLWDAVGDSSSQPMGKVFVYQRNSAGAYRLKQTITADNLSSINDLVEDITINVGDEFGHAIDLDYSGSTLVVTSPKIDKNYLNQGSVYVFQTNGYATLEYRLKQKLESYEQYPNEYFGQDVAISPNTEKIIVGAKNSRSASKTIFDTYAEYSDQRGELDTYASYVPVDTEDFARSSTTFDQGKTVFIDQPGFSGGVYVFELKDSKYFLTEKLEVNLSPNESFGHSIDVGSSVILVGSPGYIAPAPHLAVLAYDGPITGTVRLFSKKEGVSSWEIMSTQNPTVDITKIKSIALYDAEKNVKIQDIDFIDPAKMKILSAAEQEIKFKTPYDPAVYNVGTESQVVDADISWAEKHVGEVWWDISKVKWIYYEQGDISYRLGNWSSVVEGSEIAVYEWVESSLLPSEWAALADTNEGIAEGISGQPLYPDDNVYTIKQLFNVNTGELTETKYFYWVKNKVTIPNVEGRTISISSVSSLISNPLGSGTAYLTFVSSNTVIAHNFTSIVNDKFYLNIQRYKNTINANDIHNEFVLLTENVALSVPPIKIENKWIDSLIGYDTAGNRVPDPKLNDKIKYGLQYRPRQSMFVDRLTALKVVIDKINLVLHKEPFADLINFNTLSSKEEAPSEILREYDQSVDTYLDLLTVGTSRVRPAVLSVSIVDGFIENIGIVDGGFGYKSKEIVSNNPPVYKGPTVEIEGDGTGAKAISFINSQGTVVSIEIESRGKKYSIASAKIRNFSVLVKNDETLNNFWSIYAWDNSRQVFFRSKTQSYDTNRYWNYLNWWKYGYSESNRIVREITNISEEAKFNIKLGDLLRVKEYGSGGWAVIEKISDTALDFSQKYSLVGRQNGTIQLLESIYNTTIEGIGYDNTQTFDNAFYDIDNSIELRNILKAVKEDIFIGDYQIEWNRLFFASLKYAFSEQQYIDWAFKTSFLKAVHNIGELEEKFNYRNDNLSSFQQYIEEVKPYRTTVREYTSKYSKVDTHSAATTDFDLPSVYSKADNSLVVIDENSGYLSEYPWKFWSDNRGYSLVAIEVYQPGSGYNTPPKVLIEGDGTGATARAFISNGQVSGVEILTEGSGFSQAPRITLIGGTTGQGAKAVALLGNSKVRTFDLTIKFDRLSKTSDIGNFEFEQTFVASGFSAVFELKYAPTRDKSKIKLFKNNQVVLSSEYNISLFYSSIDTYSLLKGKIIFISPPAAGDVIDIIYEKNEELFDAVARINKSYAPVPGMKSKELGQLMTGIDFGGVQIQGTTFDVTGGWDALPWFTDNWDSVEAAADYYHVCDGSTLEVTLPYTPAAGQEINIYIKRTGSVTPDSYDTDEITGQVTKTHGQTLPAVVRIDDPSYNDSFDSATAANPNAQMPTFIGDGITKIVSIGDYISTEAGDILIFRPIESDGSVTITDNNLLDTKISGGTLENTGTGQRIANNTVNGIYTTARGILAEDIVIDGDKFISPDQVPAPEENIPGQVLDALSIRIFHNTVSGAAPLQTRILYGDGITKIYDIKGTIVEEKNIKVYVDKILCSTSDTDSTLLYSIDFRLNQIEFTNAPGLNSVIEIITVGIGGVSILDYTEHLADGDTLRFLTSANYSSTVSVYVTVNGEVVDVGFTDSQTLPNALPGKTVIDFGFTPPRLSKVKIICLGTGVDVDSSGVSVVGINSFVTEFDGSTRSIDIDGFANLSRGSSESSMIVEVDNRFLQGIDTNQYTLDDSYLVNITTVVGTRQVYELPIGTDPNKSPGSILASNLKVFINNEPAVFITDYVYDGVSKKIIVEQNKAQTGDVVRIENDLEAEYDIVGNNVVIRPSVTMVEFDKIEVTWFNEYPSMGIVTDEYVGGKVVYKLLNVPVSAEYVWVYKNGVRLTQDIDYTVTIPRSIVTLTALSTQADIIKIVVFGSNIFRLPSGFEIYKDMLNIYQFKRWSINDVELAADLNYYDQEILVNDASQLAEPIMTKNIPGIVYINGERIEYLRKQGNVLSQLRRGSFSTSIGTVYSAGSKVIDVGPNDTLPYNEDQSRTDFVSDGSTLIVGILDFIPQNRKDSQGNNLEFSYTETIPDGYYPCDSIEVFVSGKRLRKDPVQVYDSNISSSSVDGDKILEAEFSVDGTTASIRLTIPAPAGARISVIRKTGKIWKDAGTTGIQSGASFLDNNTPIAKFVGQKSTKLPE